MSNGIIGIIANPASGKDIRRLVAQGSVFDTSEKANILRRAIRAVDALGGTLGRAHVLIMPDTDALGVRALDGLHVSLEAEVLDMPATGSPRDSAEAARRMAERGAACIITLGGDGTNRAVAAGSGDVPLLPISTGTNNVFSTMVEGTVAGLAAATLASGAVDPELVTSRAKRLDILLDGTPADTALIDAATTRDLFIGSRALWEPDRLVEAVLTRAQAGMVGLASVGGCLTSIAPRDPRALYVRFGPGGRRVLAALAPGLVVPVAVAAWRVVDLEEPISFARGNLTVALD
ncbi:MAG: NAD(+)/NADH kinase, partial [Chloroflexi bacterium]|nr:NAD(+)/NADH kinase [Chloroflexota bacterium]